METYTFVLVKGFAGDSLSLFVNDSLIINKQVKEEPITGMERHVLQTKVH